MNKNLALYRDYDIIRRPIVTEKSSFATEAGKYIFEVDVDTDKTAVSKAVERIFNVKVVSVNIINVKGKTKFFRGTKGSRKDHKKAIVTLEKGQSIDFSVGI